MNFVKIFPDVTVSTDFATVGLEATGSASALTSTGFTVRYDAPTQSYLIDLPSYSPGGFHSFDQNTRFWNGSLENPANPGTLQNVELSIFKPSVTNPDAQFSFTTFGEYNLFGKPVGLFAFGTATPAGSVPITGSATYNAVVAGTTQNSLDYVRGSAVLNFDFGAGTLAGQMNPYLVDIGGGALSLGQYNFENTVFSAGSTQFSGDLRSGTLFGGTGSFVGMFTGPNAQELMARWNASYFVPSEMTRPDEMFGVWVGKKCC